ncbi:MAG: TIGR04222 domain-containing membrane protein [Actinomycetota bacterium]|nr:TIGR04222 domain-containing membrane protein [Actinomycetota bacterium]
MFWSAAATWGIGGIEFLVVYAGICAACFVGIWAWRQRLIGTGHLTEKLRLDECELAMLNGGSRLAVTAAAVRLRETGVLAPVLGLGVARLVAGLSNHKPIGDLTALLCLVVIVTVMAARDRHSATRVGQAVLGNERAKRRKWRSAGDIRPSVAVALFGRGVLWRVDPAFAAAWRVTRPGLGSRGDAYLPERAAGWVDGGFMGGGSGDGGGG